MSRWFLLTFVIALFVWVAQAAPQSMESAEPTIASKVETALADAIESIQKGFQGIIEDPGLNKLVQDGQKFLENAGKAIQEEASKIIPKTDKK